MTSDPSSARLGIGGAIGKAIVSLELDTKKYQAEMKTAQAQTVAGTNSMASSTSKFSAIAKQAYLAAGVAAVAGFGLLGQGRDRGRRCATQVTEHLREQRQARRRIGRGVHRTG